ncbi:MAG: SCO family protein, partial [Woeseia sp.]
VDGERDTPAVMKDYLAGFSKEFIGLTGDPGTVKRLAKQFRAPFYKDNGAGSKSGYSVAHSPQAFIVDSQGALRAEFYNASLEAMAGIANALLDDAAAGHTPKGDAY